MIKVRILHNKNSPPIDKTPIEFNTQSKVDGFGLSTPDNSIGPAGDPFRGSSSQPRHAMEERADGDDQFGYELRSVFKEEEEEECGCDGCSGDDEKLKYFELVLTPEEEIELNESLIYEKKDRCYYLAKQKYDVFPSAYASGFIVRCRKGKVGRKKKANEEITVEKKWTKARKDSVDCDHPRGFSERAHCDGRKKDESNDYDYPEDLSEKELNEGTFDKEKSQGLHGWFARKGGKGRSKGWVDCNTCRTNPKTGRKTCKTCGRQSGEKRSKYPACRPTPAACTRKGTSSKRGPMRVSWKKKKKTNEELLNENFINFIQTKFQALKKIIPKLDLKTLISKGNEILNAFNELKNLKSQPVQERYGYRKPVLGPIFTKVFNKYGLFVGGIALALLQMSGSPPEMPNETILKMINQGLSGVTSTDFMINLVGDKEALADLGTMALA